MQKLNANRLLIITLIVSLIVGAGAFPQAVQAESTEYAFNTPHGVAVDEDGILYVTDTGKHAVFVLDSDGNLIRTLGTPGASGSSIRI